MYIFDLDGTLRDTISGLCAAYEKYGYDPEDAERLLETYYNPHPLPDPTEIYAKEPKLVNQNAEPYWPAIKRYHKLYQYHLEGPRVLICSVAATDEIRIHAANWISKHLPEFHFRTFRTNSDKIDFIARIAENEQVVLWDDCPEVVKSALKMGVKVLLPRYTYNRLYWHLCDAAYNPVTICPYIEDRSLSLKI